jgi:class 3 adenylate cyclase
LGLGKREIFTVMAENTRQNRVCSVLFIDIVGYSRKTVAEQMVMKRECNELIANALGSVADWDRVILDTGDGAAVTFLGAPENALFVALRARDAAGLLAIRLGVNLGPVRLVNDLNGQENVVGDGINVAQRVMSFCQPGQLLVSRSFYEVACRLATDYVNLFTLQGEHLDKHERAHEVYTIAEDARAQLKLAEAEWLQRSTPPRPPRAGEPPLAKSSVPARKLTTDVTNEPARVFDAGVNLIVSGYSKATVEKAIADLGGAKLISPISQVGDKWVATCEHPEIAVSACKVEQLGYTRIVTGPSREAVSAKVEELRNSGAILVGDIESIGGKWTAVCEMGDAGR